MVAEKEVLQNPFIEMQQGWGIEGLDIKTFNTINMLLARQQRMRDWVDANNGMFTIYQSLSFVNC
jgi:hypothetical protein